jgi:ureidoglycolate lyase
MADCSARVQELSPQVFAAYGRVISMPERDADGSGPGWRWWAETAVLPGDGRPWGIGYLQLEPTPQPRFDWAERHLRTSEAVIPLGGPCLVYAAPAQRVGEPERPPAPDGFEIFRVPPGSGVILEAGVWHGAPLADAGPTTAVVLILEGTGRDDVTISRFQDTPVTVRGAASNGEA